MIKLKKMPFKKVHVGFLFYSEGVLWVKVTEGGGRSIPHTAYGCCSFNIDDEGNELEEGKEVEVLDDVGVADALHRAIVLD